VARAARGLRREAQREHLIIGRTDLARRDGEAGIILGLK
jgi:hypothetical protein